MENENLELPDLAIPESPMDLSQIDPNLLVDENNIPDPLEQVLNFDYTQDFNLETHYQVIQDYKTNHENLKAREAENVADELGTKYLNTEFQEEMERVKTNFYTLVKKYDVNSDLIKAINEKGPEGEPEKDKVYALAQFIKNNYIEMVNNLLFNIELSIEEYKFIDNTFRTKISYDGNEIFNIQELKEKYLDPWTEKFKGLNEKSKILTLTVVIDIKNVVMMYHFLQKYTVKGMTKEFYTFLELLMKIGETNKLFNAFTILKDRVETDFLTWAGSISVNETEISLEVNG